MSYPTNYPTPQGANTQIFNVAFRNSGANRDGQTWIKPQGASFIWFTLIGAGGSGSNGDGVSTVGDGGGSGAITNCLMPAFLVPDKLSVYVGMGGGYGAVSAGQATTVYHTIGSTQYTLLVANAGGAGSPGTGGTGALQSSGNYFSAAGLYQSTAGVNGSSATPTGTILSPGTGANYGSSYTGNFGYKVQNNVPVTPTSPGFFMMQPILVGLGGLGQNTTDITTVTPSGGIGCGGAGSSINSTGYGLGGDGLCVIISW